MTKIQALARSETLALWARMIQIVGVPIGLTLGAWFVSAINGLEREVTRLDTQMTERTTDRYTATDAKHDFAVIGVEVGDLDRRVGVLEADELSSYRGRR